MFNTYWAPAWTVTNRFLSHKSSEGKKIWQQEVALDNLWWDSDWSEMRYVMGAQLPMKSSLEQFVKMQLLWYNNYWRPNGQWQIGFCRTNPAKRSKSDSGKYPWAICDETLKTIKKQSWEHHWHLWWDAEDAKNNSHGSTTDSGK